ncbi:MAG: membrane integrity-associated transporter subunit PqiC [Halomonadaceae bacterium]|nr:MAG: membrane integrity-associated transporter subunit PqiC [Halomonadaceae bacterium]
MTQLTPHWRLLLPALLLLLAGCATSPETRYYTLMGTEPASQPEQLWPLTVTRVQMPEYLDDSRLWVRSQGYQITALANVRWAESLPRATTRSLQQHLGTVSDAAGGGERLLVDLDAFEARWSDSGEQDQVVLRGQWQVAGAEGSAQRIQLQADLSDRNPATLVAAMSGLLKQLAEEITRGQAAYQ